MMLPFEIDCTGTGTATISTAGDDTTLSGLLFGNSDTDKGLDWKVVLSEERAWLHRSRVARSVDDGGKFSLAFSGGGIRAAAFQAGVLWRLAHMDRLKNVEYIAAVSGGGYIATAFASHCRSFAADPPCPGGERAWYLRVVAATLCRMQANAGDFIRDSVRNPCYGSEGAGRLPRVFDLPILLGSVFLTLLVNPVTFVVVVFLPFTLYVQRVFGPAMLAAFCLTDDDFLKTLEVFQEESKLSLFLKLIAVVTVLNMVVWLLRKLPSCRIPKRQGDEGDRPKAHLCFFIGHAANAVLLRTLLMMIGSLFIAMAAILLDVLVHRDLEERWRFCQTYIDRHEQNPNPNNHSFPVFTTCDDSFKGRPWWYNDNIQKQIEHGPLCWHQHYRNNSSRSSFARYAPDSRKTFKIIFSLFGIFILVSLCCVPALGPRLSSAILIWMLPFAIMVWLILTVQFIVFGTMTGIRNVLVPYSKSKVNAWIGWGLFLSAIIVPVYAKIRSIMHHYYRDCLRKNFFHGGRDINFVELARCNLCPFLILTATTTDFQAPGDRESISEMCMSPLHIGSVQTSYVRMPHFRSLSKCAALSGAGLLDAISLTMSKRSVMRIWSTSLNLTWGDYVWFERRRTPWWGYVFRKLRGRRLSGEHLQLLQQSPSILLQLCAIGFLSLGWSNFVASDHEDHACQKATNYIQISCALHFLLLVLSIFSVIDFDLFTPSQFTHEFFRFTKYIFHSNFPPRLLYLTDGGVKDCTAILQLMQRRCMRILLILANDDPDDELAVLRTAMREAEKQQIGSFYDPDEPRRCVGVALEQFRRDKSAPYLRLGIFYSWDGRSAYTGGGQLFIVKNRLPPELQHQPLHPLLTEAEICGEEPVAEVAKPTDCLTTDQLGSCGCCDCCHTLGLNCGPKFPHGNFMGYLCLTPQWFNSLARLGFAVSEPAIEAITCEVP